MNTSQSEILLDFYLVLPDLYYEVWIFVFKDVITSCDLLSLQYQLVSAAIPEQVILAILFCCFIGLIWLLQGLIHCKDFSIDFCCFILNFVSSVSPTKVAMANKITGDSETPHMVFCQWLIQTLPYIALFPSYEPFPAFLGRTVQRFAHPRCHADQNNHRFVKPGPGLL